MRTIGHYEVVREIGRGGMGAVYEGRDLTVDGRRVALKVVLEAALDPEALVRFEREARLLARVHHPGVVRVHALERAERAPVLVTELIEGARPLERGPLPAREAARIVRAVADAVEAVHQAGVLHRDLKPANVVRRADGSLVLLDFGVARELDGSSLTRTGDVVGTPEFMAPEQIEGRRALDARVDVYGLGALLYALLVGDPPFKGGAVQVMTSVLERDPAWPAQRVDTPAGLDRIVRRAMAKRATDRPASAAALRDELDAWLAAPPEGRGARRSLVIGAAAGLLLIPLVATVHHVSAPPPAAASPPATSQAVEAPLPTSAPGPSAVEADALTALLAGWRAGALGALRDQAWLTAPVPDACRSDEYRAVRASFIDARRLAVSVVRAPRAAVATITTAGRVTWDVLDPLADVGGIWRITPVPGGLAVGGDAGLALVALDGRRVARVLARTAVMEMVSAALPTGAARLLCYGGGAVWFVDTDGAAAPVEVLKLTGSPGELELALSPDGRMAIVIAEESAFGPLRASVLQARRLPATAAGQVEPVTVAPPASPLTRKTLAFTRDGRFVFGGDARSLELWDANAARLDVMPVEGDRYRLPALTRVAPSPAGTTVYAASGTFKEHIENELVAWSRGDDGAVRRVGRDRRRVRSLAVSPDGLFLAVGNDEDALELWIAGDDPPPD